jgi:hypothetical protein
MVHPDRMSCTSVPALEMRVHRRTASAVGKPETNQRLDNVTGRHTSCATDAGSRARLRVTSPPLRHGDPGYRAALNRDGVPSHANRGP